MVNPETRMKYRLSPFLKAAAVFAVVASTHAHASTLINVDFDAGDSNGASPTQTGAAYIGLSGDGWNSAPSTDGNGSLSTLLDASGNATEAGFSYTANGGSGDDPNGSSKDAATTALMEDYIYSNSSLGAAPTLTLSNLSAFTGDTFTLILYASGNFAGQGGTFTLSEDGITGQTLTTTAADRLISNGIGDAFQVFTGTVSGGDITITGAYANGNSYSVMNGLQVQFDSVAAVPEPSTGSTVLLSMALSAGIYTLRRRTFTR